MVSVAYWEDMGMNEDKRIVLISIISKACRWYAAETSELHRDDDKHAAIQSNGTKEWWVNGERVR